MRPNGVHTGCAHHAEPFGRAYDGPMNARLVESVRPASALTDCGDFSEAANSRAGFVAFQTIDFDPPDVGRHGFAKHEPDHSAGTRSLTSTLTNRPSRGTAAVWCTPECSAAEARSAR